MKNKWILRAGIAVFVILVVVIVVVAFSLGSIVKAGVERVGPTATKVDVKLKAAEVWIVAARIQLSGIFVGNPPGYKTPSAISVHSVSVAVKPGSVFSDKLVVASINVKAPVITLEGGLTENNLKRIEKNLNDYIGTSSTAPNSSAPASSPAKPERKLQVDDFEISGAQLQVNSPLTGGRTMTLKLPDIHLTDLGTGPEGITPVELSQRALHAILTAATTKVAKNAGNLGKDALSGSKGVGQKAADFLKGMVH